MAGKDAEMSFAERMMKNMGWSEGKGLGKQEAGIKDIIKPKMKFNTKGIGYMDVDNKWIAHQEHFDDLLTSLNKGEKPAQQRDISCLTSESKLKGRTKFYAKMMRGKDLSNRSSQDISAIIVPLSKKNEVGKPETESLPSEVDGTLKSSQVSMSDYFAKMMAQRKAKLSEVQSSATEAVRAVSDETDHSPETIVEDSAVDEGPKKNKRKKTAKAREIETCSRKAEEAVEETRKRKKRKLEPVQDEQIGTKASVQLDQNQCKGDEGEVDDEKKQKTTKEKKGRIRKNDCDGTTESADVGFQESSQRKKERNSNRSKGGTVLVEADMGDSHTNGETAKESRKSKKKKVEKSGQVSENNEKTTAFEDVDSSKPKERKVKKAKHKLIEEEFEITEEGTRLNVDLALLKEIRGKKLAKSTAAPVRNLTEEQIQEIYHLWTSGEYAKFMRKIHRGELPRWVAVEKPQLDRMISGKTKLIDLSDVREVLDTKWKTANVDEIWGYTNLAYLAI